LSQEAVDVVESMLTMEPSERPEADFYKKMSYFNDIDFDNIMAVEPPFIPNPNDPLDTGYFNAKNEIQQLKLSNFEMSQI
jgi:serine/threonine-protein kinase greatwall